MPIRLHYLDLSGSLPSLPSCHCIQNSASRSSRRVPGPHPGGAKSNFTRHHYAAKGFKVAEMDPDCPGTRMSSGISYARPRINPPPTHTHTPSPIPGQLRKTNHLVTNYPFICITLGKVASISLRIPTSVFFFVVVVFSAKCL